MAEQPRLVRVNATTYKCNACPNFQVIINPHKKLDPGQIRANIAKREAQHIKQVHS